MRKITCVVMLYGLVLAAAVGVVFAGTCLGRWSS